MNNVMLTGHLGAAPRSRFLENGAQVTDFDLAVNRRYTSNGQTVEQTTWVNVTAWRQLAATCAEYLDKGRHVLVTGRLEQADAYIDRDGKARSRNRVTAINVEFLGSGANVAAGPEMEGALEAAASTTVVNEHEIMAAQVNF